MWNWLQKICIEFRDSLKVNYYINIIYLCLQQGYFMKEKGNRYYNQHNKIKNIWFACKWYVRVITRWKRYCVQFVLKLKLITRPTLVTQITLTKLQQLVSFYFTRTTTKMIYIYQFRWNVLNHWYYFCLFAELTTLQKNTANSHNRRNVWNHPSFTLSFLSYFFCYFANITQRQNVTRTFWNKAEILKPSSNDKYLNHKCSMLSFSSLRYFPRSRTTCVIPWQNRLIGHSNSYGEELAN